MHNSGQIVFMLAFLSGPDLLEEIDYLITS